MMKKLLLAAVLVSLASGLSADVLILRNGDRITGEVLAEGARAFTLQTPFGRLTIPRGQVHKVIRADGHEETVNPASATETAGASAPAPSPAGSPMPGAPGSAWTPGSGSGARPGGATGGTGGLAGSGTSARLGLIITGTSFWQAWPPKDVAADPSLRFRVELDDKTIATYTDAKLDAGEIEGALVNTFSFLPAEVTVRSETGAALAPETRPGRIVLRMDVGAASAEPHHLRLIYQGNVGTAQEPSWKDLASGSGEVRLSPGGFTFLQVRQERGQMEYSGFTRHRMKNVETFVIEIVPDSGVLGRP